MARWSPARRRRPGAPEHGLQRSLVAWWRSCVKDGHHGFLFAVPNGAKRSAKQGSVNTDAPPAYWLLHEGLRAGVSDLVLMLPGGRSVFIEVKIDNTLLTNKTYQTEQQQEFEAVCIRLQHTYRIVRSIEQFADLCDEFGVPYRARPMGGALLKPVKAALRAPSRAKRGAALAAPTPKAPENSP
jgi:hypothetical protein